MTFVYFTRQDLPIAQGIRRCLAVILGVGRDLSRYLVCRARPPCCPWDWMRPRQRLRHTARHPRCSVFEARLLCRLGYWVRPPRYLGCDMGPPQCARLGLLVANGTGRCLSVARGTEQGLPFCSWEALRRPR